MRWMSLACALAWSAAAWACGPGAHAYIAMRALGNTAPCVAFAAGLPDVNGVFSALPEANARMKHLTHFEFARLKGTAFAAGFATHNNVWGADSVAHAYFLPDPPDNYFTRKLHALSEQTGITLHEAEDLFDAAIDIQLARTLGPELGRALVAGAEACGPAEEAAFTAAFAEPLAESTAEPLTTAQTQLRWALRCAKQGTIAYGTLLQSDMRRQMPVAGLLVAKVFHWTYAEALVRLNAAITLAADVQPALDAIADDIRQHLEEDPAYREQVTARASQDAGGAKGKEN